MLSEFFFILLLTCQGREVADEWLILESNGGKNGGRPDFGKDSPLVMRLDERGIESLGLVRLPVCGAEEVLENGKKERWNVFPCNMVEGSVAVPVNGASDLCRSPRPDDLGRVDDDAFCILVRSVFTPNFRVLLTSQPSIDNAPQPHPPNGPSPNHRATTALTLSAFSSASAMHSPSLTTALIPS